MLVLLTVIAVLLFRLSVIGRSRRSRCLWQHQRKRGNGLYENDDEMTDSMGRRTGPGWEGCV
ncbi:MAG: hypothetical protein ACLUOI_08105 [Eisenbergiella sp.]